jgi:tRNA pseudouridine55 synthase
VVALGVDPAPATAGALLVDKPSGPTSHDVVACVRRALRTSRVGHTGTLDPLATGLLVVLVGPATRLAQFLAADDKEYIADVRLGVSTPTYDAASLAEGVRSMTTGDRWPTDAEVETVLQTFRGSFLQTPPPYSAKKVGGVAAYERARQNRPVALEPVSVTVRQLCLLPASEREPQPSPIDTRSSGLERRDPSLLRLRVASSAGFYVRSLAHDLGVAFGCGAHLEALRRTRVGRFRVEDAVTLAGLGESCPAAVLPPDVILGEMPSARLTESGTRRAVHGNPVGPEATGNGDSRFFSDAMGAVPFFVRLLDPGGVLVAVAEARRDGLLHPVVVLG